MKPIIISVCSIILVFFSCKEAFVRQLDKVNVNLMAPGDNVTSDSLQQDFFWQPVDSNINYEFQIVTPGFDSIVELVVDTVITTNTFLFTMKPGIYQWRVRAYNSASSTNFSEPWIITIN